MRSSVVLFWCWMAPSVSSQPLSVELEEKRSGLGVVTDIQSAGDSRLFVVERQGLIQWFEIDSNGDLVLPSTTNNTFLDISDSVSAGGERGLLGLAFHPDFRTNRYLFVNYINNLQDTTISRFTATSDGSFAQKNTELVVAEIDQPFGNHNGGQLQFSNGYLYIGMGDGGGSNDPDQRGQSFTTLLGKMLRVDVDDMNEQGTIPIWSVPGDNPFVGTLPSPFDAIWAYGLRNPWRFSFDRQTGDMLIGDVGQRAREEVSFQPASSTGGENYGWGFCEGSRLNTDYGVSFPAECLSCGDDSTCFVAPVLEYDRSLGASITGGFVYRGMEYASLIDGVYFYADFGSGTLWGARQRSQEPGWSNEIIVTNVIAQPSTFGEDQRGELYIGTAGGVLYQIKAVAAPTVSPAPTGTLLSVVPLGLTSAPTALLPSPLPLGITPAPTELPTPAPLPTSGGTTVLGVVWTVALWVVLTLYEPTLAQW